MEYTYDYFGKCVQAENSIALSICHVDESDTVNLSVLYMEELKYYLSVYDGEGVCLLNQTGAFVNVSELQTLDGGDVLLQYCSEKVVLKKDQHRLLLNYLKQYSEAQQGDLSDMSGVEFEQLIYQLVRKMGFEAQQTKASGDGGIDIVAYNSQPFLEGTYIIQCKRWSSSIGEPILRDLYGVVMSERANKGILVTTSYFTASAINFSEGKPIELIDGKKLLTLLNKYDLSYKKYNYDSIASFDLENYFKNYDSIVILQDEVSRNSNNSGAYFMLASIFMDRIMNDIHYHGHLSRQEMDFLATKCRQWLIVLEKTTSRNKQDIGRAYIAHLFDAQLSLVQGEIIDALNHYHHILQWDYFTATFPDGSFRNCNYMDFYAIITNIVQIYKGLGLKEKAINLCKKYNRVLNSIIEEQEIIYFESIDGTDDITVFDSNNKVDYKKTRERYVERVKNCEASFFIFWDNRLYITSGSHADKEVHQYVGTGANKAEVYYLHFGTRHLYDYDTSNRITGLVGFPPWNDSVIDNMEDVIKKTRILY